MDHIFTEKYPKMLYNNVHLKLLIMTIVTEGLKGNPGAWTYLARITFMKHFEQIRGALVPLQSKNQDRNHTKRKSVGPNFDRWNKNPFLLPLSDFRADP